MDRISAGSEGTGWESIYGQALYWSQSIDATTVGGYMTVDGGIKQFSFLQPEFRIIYGLPYGSITYSSLCSYKPSKPNLLVCGCPQACSLARKYRSLKKKRSCGFRSAGVSMAWRRLVTCRNIVGVMCRLVSSGSRKRLGQQAGKRSVQPAGRHTESV